MPRDVLLSLAIERDVEQAEPLAVMRVVWLHGFEHDGSRSALGLQVREPQHDDGEGPRVDTSAAGRSECAANLQDLAGDRDEPDRLSLVQALQIDVKLSHPNFIMTELTK